MWKSRLRQSPASFRQKKLKQSFDLFDPDGEGFISVQDLQKAILSLGINKMQINLQARIKQFSSSGQMIGFEAFEEIMTGYNPSDSVDDIKNIFKRFDFGNKGFINADDLKKVSWIVGQTMTDKQIDDLLKISEDRQVRFQQFYNVLTKPSFGF